MSDFAKKVIVFLIFAVIAGTISFTYARMLRDEADKYGGGTDGIEMVQCVKQFEKRLPSKTAAESACECTITEFKRRKLELTDMLTGDRPEMQKIADSCIAMAS
ncbi:hypothetical protein [Croceicoccus bisphenolivorans]|uniref:hypothetical protein n=1 Tax=Croceicoccus bisphenolivorans TaxID=1783232 RepID=UPI000829F53B|nr:hypothetical protein [Croceicoccus bisphenolivorans]